MEIRKNKDEVVKDDEKRLRSQIQDILEAINATEDFIAGMDFQDFSRDQKTIYAIERSVGIIGATAKRLPVEFRDRHSEIVWRDIATIGDKLTYGFFEVDLADLWDITQNDVPKIKNSMLKATEELCHES